MFEFSIRLSGTSDEIHILFLPDFDNQKFREALKVVMAPHGFNCLLGKEHIYIDMVRGDRKLKKLTISSDEWCVFGETMTRGKDPELNYELIMWLKDELIKSNLFKLKGEAT